MSRERRVERADNQCSSIVSTTDIAWAAGSAGQLAKKRERDRGGKREEANVVQLSKESERKEKKRPPMSRRRRHAAAGVSALFRQLHVRERPLALR